MQIKQKVLFVHPEMSTIRQMVLHMGDTPWQSIYVTSSEDAMKRIDSIHPDVVFIELGCAYESNKKFLNLLKSDIKYKNILVMVSVDESIIEEITSDVEEFGIDEVLIHPYNTAKLKFRINHILRHQKRESFLNKKIGNKIVEVEKLKDAVIYALGSVNEYRNQAYSKGNVEKVQNLVKDVANELKNMGHYKEILTTPYIELLYKSAPLHDIGKIGISDCILFKKSKLDPLEREAIKQHTKIGEDIVASIITRVGYTEFLQSAMEMAGCHHEKWDGTGYPRGIEGEVIPLSARIMSVVDVFNALTSNRAYRMMVSFEEAVEIIKSQSGTYFDPIVVEAFLNVKDKYKK